MDWLLLWWLMSDDRYDEPERPRYFRESPPREETKEKKEGESSLSHRSMYACNWHTNYLSRYWLPTVRCSKSIILTITKPTQLKIVLAIT